MRLLLALFFLVIVLNPSFSYARAIDADLAVHSVDIDHDFNGMDILMFGARNDIGRILVAIRGQEKSYVVRKKERVSGIWVNKDSVEFKHVPGFFALAASSNLKDIRNDSLLESLKLGSRNLDFQVVEKSEGIAEAEVSNFVDALIKNKVAQGLYAEQIDEVTFWGETLFRTVLKFPENIAKGVYTAEIYLFDDGKLSAVQSTPIKVSKIGFEAYFYELAHEVPWVYGLVSVIIAVFAGWFANRVMAKG